jgi:hypothetical protein
MSKVDDDDYKRAAEEVKDKYPPFPPLDAN